MSLDSMNKIKNVTEHFGKYYSKVMFYNLGEDFKGATIFHSSLSLYYRIALPSILSNIDRVIYSDLDVLNFKDLTEMYNIKFNKDMYICAVLDNLSIKKEIEDLGIKSDKYINSGVLLMDLKTMREKSVEKKLRDYIKTHVFDRSNSN